MGPQFNPVADNPGPTIPKRLEVYKFLGPQIFTAQCYAILLYDTK